MKIRGRKRKSENQEVEGLFQERKILKQEINRSKNNAVQNCLEEAEKNIARLISDKNTEKINRLFQNISNSDSSCNTLGMWKQIKQLFRKILKTVPSGVKNDKGKIVTKVGAVKQIIMRKYIIRLRKRPANPELKYLMQIKEENSKRIINIAREIKTPPWTEEDIFSVLKSLKSNKCRDPYSMVNEIFKPGVIGTHLQIALLDLFNKCKSEMKIPDFMTVSHIVNVWKKKGDKMDID